MKRIKRLGWILMLILLLDLLRLSSLWAADLKVPKPAARDKCPVCGMFVFKYPDWLAAIRFRDGSHVYFDGAKDLFKFLQNPQKYGAAVKPEDIETIAVTDYYRLAWIDAHKAWYVIGSDVYGPMGRELIPLVTEDEAKEFMKDHKGKRIIRFSEVTPEVVGTLD